MKNSLTYFSILFILSLVGHACTVLSPSTQQPTYTTFSAKPSSSAFIMTGSQTPIATGQTSIPSTSILMTPTPTQVPIYFTEEWDGDTYQWFGFSTTGDSNLWDVYNEAGVLVFSLTGKKITNYFIYQPWGYDQVQVTAQIENRTLTKSTTIIVCDYSDSLGWYEFDIDSDGLWQIRVHDTLGQTGYLSLMNGGSKAIHTGAAVNEYTITCIGNKLSLTINGTKAAEYTDNILKFTNGKIGLGAISYTELPVLLESAWIKISTP